MPNQLFAAGALRLHHARLTALDFFDVMPGMYGMHDDFDMGAHDSYDEGVVVPTLDFAMTQEQ